MLVTHRTSWLPTAAPGRARRASVANVFVVPYQATGTEGEPFMEAARAILESMRVEPR
jgi:hypothetical protein